MPTTFRDPAKTMSKGATPLSGPYYTAPEIFEQELERIFYERWVYVGRAEQIPDPGDYILYEIGRESIIVVRTADEKIQGHYNVCRHRGTRLCVKTQGQFNKTIQCPYHAWTYGLDGQLLGAPHMNGVATFDKKNYPLTPVAINTWEGFVFANLSSEPAPLTEAFAPLAGKFSSWDMPKLRSAHRIDYEVQANWKLIVENYSECYHCPLIHPELVRRTDYLSGINDLYEGAFLGGYMNMLETSASMTLSGEASSRPIGSVSGEDLSRVYYYSIFPNILLSLHPDYVMVHRLMPQTPARTTVICEWLFDPEVMTRPNFSPDDAVEFWDITNRQDWQACEWSQMGVSSRAYIPGPYSGREGLLAAFDEEVRRTLGHSPGT